MATDYNDGRVPVRRRAPVPVPKWKDDDAFAMQALEKGEANAEQQKQALQWIVRQACQFYEICDQPENERLSAIFEGRRFVGAQILKLIFLNVTRTEEKKNVYRTQSTGGNTPDTRPNAGATRPSRDPKHRR